MDSLAKQMKLIRQYFPNVVWYQSEGKNELRVYSYKSRGGDRVTITVKARLPVEPPLRELNEEQTIDTVRLWLALNDCLPKVDTDY